MATVYHAYDPRFERDVAIKVLPREFLHDPQFRARFEREAKMIALLEHPAIVPVYDFGEEEGQPFIVMRYMSGGSLADRLQQKAFSLAESVEIIDRLAPALDAAHSKGIVHRDLKPGNILFDQYGNAFLSDFGIARLSQAGGGTLTGTAILGTPSYMSPEQVQGDKEIDGRSDVYAFGVIFFQMITGSVPYQADTPAKIMIMHLLEPIPLLQKAKQDVPEEYQDVIKHAMAKEPDQRFSTAGEMAAAVNSILRGEKTTPITAESTEPTATRISAGSISAKTTVAQKTTAIPVKTAAPAKKRFASLGLVIGGVIGLGLIGALVVAGVLIFSPKGNAVKPTATQLAVAAVITPTPSATQAPTNTPQPIPPTLPPTLASTDTPRPTETMTATTLPTSTPTPQDTEAPTPTTTDTIPPVPAVVVIGGADMIAFLNKNNIYVVNIDGTQLTQLTTDNAEKQQLEWTSDGQKIIYISGTSIKSVDLSGQVNVVASFSTAEYLDAFEISPDNTKVAISLNKELFIVPLDWDKLVKTHAKSGLMAMATDCPDHAPFANYSVKTVQWSADSKYLAINFLGSDVNGKWNDLIDVLDVSYCGQLPTRVDEFPATRFTISGYDKNPTFQNFAWDGTSLFAMTGFIRNDGYGNLYVYNMERHQPRTTIQGATYIDPIHGSCCYRDPRWSPDGQYLMFVFQDIGLGANSVSKLYFVPYSSIGTGATYDPIPLPADFLTNPKEKPQPALRPAR